MCMNENGNKILSCTVGDLRPGQEYRTPDGRTMTVMAGPSGFVAITGEVPVVDLSINKFDLVPASTKLGHDRRDRLYASRYLNPPAQRAVFVDPNATGADDEDDYCDLSTPLPPDND